MCACNAVVTHPDQLRVGGLVHSTLPFTRNMLEESCVCACVCVRVCACAHAFLHTYLTNLLASLGRRPPSESRTKMDDLQEETLLPRP